MLLIFFVFLLLIHFLIKCTNFHKAIDAIPGPLCLPFIGTAWTVIFRCPENCFKALRQLNKKYFPLWRFWFCYDAAAFIFSPNDIQKILNNHEQIEKGMLYKVIKPWLNKGLLLSTGEQWFKRRKILTNSFHFNILKEFFRSFISSSDKLVEELQKECNQKQTSITYYLSETTLKIICETAMGTKLDAQNGNQKHYMTAIKKICKIMFYRLTTPGLFYDSIFYLCPMASLQRKLLETLQTFTNRVIKEREKNFNSNILLSVQQSDLEDDSYFVKTKPRLAMLDLLLAAKINGKQIDDQGIREEVDTFMFEGHDTTSVALQYIFMVLANYTDIQDKVVEEINEILFNKKWPPSFEDMQKFNYLERCIKETLRLYPSVPIITRIISKDITTESGHQIPKGTNINLHIFDIHRNPAYFPDPEKFDPDRFLPEVAQHRHPFVYIPFSAGPRNCIGQRFALLELKTIVINVLRNYVLTAITKPTDIVFICDLVLRTKHDIKVKFTPRNL